MGKCIYCKAELPENSPIDVCASCGYSVWGEKMFNTIVQNMENARDEGNLFQGSVSDEKSIDKSSEKVAGNGNVEFLNL